MKKKIQNKKYIHYRIKLKKNQNINTKENNLLTRKSINKNLSKIEYIKKFKNKMEN